MYMKKFRVRQNIREQRVTRVVLGLLFLGSILLIHIGFTNTYAAGVFSKNEKPFGIPYDEWVGKYWKWFITVTPEQSEPANGSCMINKTGSMIMSYDPSVGGNHQ